ncbi:phosphotransacetylase [Calidifontibacter sp. DB0510]|uniref:Phosphotransacetylase n=1 Tax=Metallococcus carri TaxID=1656884 RepID=A0A967B0T9_9MICO|nr:phosphotransacetylase [Metallococcus carri]NHN56706.1 phosphotransacetylase [Metallococcus carri]NOP37917.1 phosphotransacetylase [Calidifontibacter sp. DB2511S]
MSGSLTDDWVRALTARAPGAVVLAESDDPRVRAAANRLADKGIDVLLLTDDDAGASTSVETITLAEARDHTAPVLNELADRRQWSGDQRASKLSDPLYLAAALVKAGRAGSAVAGALHPSGEVIRAGLHVLGLASGIPLLSSCFVLRLRDERTVAFADCAVVPTPDAAGLAAIARSTAGTYAALTGDEPSVAMLSFSTLGSAEHADVALVQAATELVRQQDPDLAVEGELQFDAAFVPEVARSKAPDSPVAGHANVFVFPNLAAGNIGYKIAQRIGGAAAYGPVLQGLSQPMNDLSRGCEVDDIVNVALIGALQSVRSPRPAHA